MMTTLVSFPPIIGTSTMDDDLIRDLRGDIVRYEAEAKRLEQRAATLRKKAMRARNAIGFLASDLQ